MLENNTLFILARYGIYSTDTLGIQKSMMWLLTSEDESMEYVSFHKSKSSRAYRGGKIIDARKATESEILTHQNLMVQENQGEMLDVNTRKIITFKMIPNWNKLWPLDAQNGQMAYKGLGYLKINK